MEINAPTSDSHLFLIRLWQETEGEGKESWCGKVQHVVSGEARYFRDWPALIDLLLAVLPDLVPGMPITQAAATPEPDGTGREALTEAAEGNSDPCSC